MKGCKGLAEKKPEMYGQYLAGWEKRAQHVLAQLSEYFQDEMPKVRAIDETDVEDDVPNLTEGNPEIQARDTEELLKELHQITTELNRRLKNNTLFI